MKQVKDLVVGDVIKAVYIGGAYKYYKIKGMDDLFYRDQHDDLATSTTESYAAVTALNPPIDQLYWICQIMVDGNVQVYMKQPAATNRWGTNTAPAGGMINDTFTPPLDMWIAEDYPPNVQIVNSTNVTVTPVLTWIGKTFSIQEIKENEAAGYTSVKVGGLAE